MTRFGYVMTAYFASMATIITAFVHPAPRLIWNASASVPVGLYRMEAATSPEVGDLVAATPPDDLGAFMAGRHYLPRGVPLLKHVAAIGGQRVCRRGDAIVIDGHRTGTARGRDRLGRPLPRWSGCRKLAHDQIFLMNAAVPDSFDGRYFGPLPARNVIGRLSPVWTTTASPPAGALPQTHFPQR